MLREDDRQRFETPPPGRMLEYVEAVTSVTTPPDSAEWDAAHVAAKLNEIFDTCTVVEVTLIKTVIQAVIDDLRVQLTEQLIDRVGLGDLLIVIEPNERED